MKKKIYLLATAILLSVASPAVMAKSKPAEAPLTEQQQAKLQSIEARVMEIKKMDKSSLTRQERKDLRNELQGMKKEAKAMAGGVYLSVGAIIIIILLLILLL